MLTSICGFASVVKRNIMVERAHSRAKLPLQGGWRGEVRKEEHMKRKKLGPNIFFKGSLPAASFPSFRLCFLQTVPLPSQHHRTVPKPSA